MGRECRGDWKMPGSPGAPPRAGARRRPGKREENLSMSGLRRASVRVANAFPSAQRQVYAADQGREAGTMRNTNCTRRLAVSRDDGGAGGRISMLRAVEGLTWMPWAPVGNEAPLSLATIG